MQMFGLLSLIITIGLISWWLVAGSGPLQTSQNDDGTTKESTYQEEMGGARDVVNKSDERNKALEEAMERD